MELILFNGAAIGLFIGMFSAMGVTMPYAFNHMVIGSWQHANGNGANADAGWGFDWLVDTLYR